MTMSTAQNGRFRARIVGAGSYVPEVRMTTERISRVIPGWSPERIVDRTGIVERRYLWDLDDSTGKPIMPTRVESDAPVCGTDMCDVALRKALRMAGLDAESLDAIFLVTCTPDQPSFCHDAMMLARRLHCRADCRALHVDSGCGGAMYLLDLAARMIGAGALKTVALVASNFTSALVDRDLYAQSATLSAANEKSLGAFLSVYVFGDAASAIVLRADESQNGGVIASIAGNEDLNLVLKPGGGALLPGYSDRTRPIDMAFLVHGTLVYKSYMRRMRQNIEDILEIDKLAPSDVARYYLHQPNKRLFDNFTTSMELRPEQTPTTVAHYGNTSAAGMFVLLAEDLERGRVSLGSGELVTFCAIGAGVQHGAQLVRL
jgi:3-oxoacyl-[acyl-carrier-protein] synthase III